MIFNNFICTVIILISAIYSIGRGTGSENFQLPPHQFNHSFQTVYYVIIGAFSELGNAEKYFQKISAKEENAELGYHPENDIFYLYLFKSLRLDSALVERKKIIEKYKDDHIRNGFDHAWILSSTPLINVNNKKLIFRLNPNSLSPIDKNAPLRK